MNKVENSLRQNTEPLVSVRNLKKHFNIQGKGKLHAVDNISFDIQRGQTLGLVGESGCGKSTVGNVLIRLLKETSGDFLLDEKNVFKMSGKENFEFRKQMQIIFQDPYSSLNPKKTISKILEESYKIHKLYKGNELKKKVEEITEMVGLEKYILEQYPYELDGGKRQLVGIARALSLNPKFIVCDEPVSALDVSVQAKVLNVLIDLQKNLGLTYLFISHDLSVVRHISNRVAVMYLGQIVEIADTDDIFENTTHPYTIALLSAIPVVDIKDRRKRLVLTGDVPSPLNPPTFGCRFAGRCWMAKEDCKAKTPSLVEIGPGHQVACHYWKESQMKSEELISNTI